MAIGRAAAIKRIRDLGDKIQKLISDLEEVDSEKFEDDAGDAASALEDVLTSLGDVADELDSGA